MDLRAIRDRLRQMSEHGPALTARVRQLDGDVRDWQARRDGIVHQVSGLAAKVAASQPALKELDNAKRTLSRNQDRLAESLNNSARLAARVDVSIDWPKVTELVSALQRELAELQLERQSLDAAPAMRNLLDRIVPQLDSADAQGLGDQVAIDDPVNDIELTVSQSRAGMAARRTFLEGKPPEPQAREVAERLSAVEKRLADARILMESVQEIDRWQRLVATNEARVEAALGQINPGAIEQIRKLQAQLREADAKLLQLAAERAVTLQQLGAMGDETTRQSLKAKLDQSLRERNIVEDQLAEKIAAAEVLARQAQGVTTRARDVAASLRREVARADLEIRDATTRLLNAPELEWVRQLTTGTAVLAGAESARSRADAVDKVRRVIDAVLHRLTDFRSQVGAVETALRNIARRMEGREPESERYVTALTSHFNTHFSEWFNNPRVRHELLPAAEGAISVDLERREVTWHERGQTLARPLEAFSSGEQAFAYTRARLAILDEVPNPPERRLIVLDEFGAFIAHDRLAGLFSYLQERSRDHRDDQVLIILPLSRDYPELSRSAAGPERVRYETLAKEVANRGYAIQVLST
jgi:chromosome segregation ATPase